MRYLYILLLIPLYCIALPPANYKDYCNARFAFCIEYPPNFSPPHESQNADGAYMTSPDKKAEIRGYGSLLDSELSKTAEEEYAIESGGIHVTYHLAKDNWVIFSGTDSATGKIVYQKTIARKIDYWGDEDTPVFQTLRITYPATQSAQYAAYCTYISKEFK